MELSLTLGLQIFSFLVKAQKLIELVDAETPKLLFKSVQKQFSNDWSKVKNYIGIFPFKFSSHNNIIASFTLHFSS